MKKIFFVLIAIVPFLIAGCEKDTWSEGDPAYEHIYYFGFQDWGKLKNDVTFKVTGGETLSIPVQFHSERVRNYDVETFYYVSGTAIYGTDYQIVDSLGVELAPNDSGAFAMSWPEAIKGIKKVYVKTTTGATGTFLVHTFNPNAVVPISNTDVSTTTNNKTSQYEVRAFFQNNRVTVTIQ